MRSILLALPLLGLLILSACSPEDPPPLNPPLPPDTTAGKIEAIIANQLGKSVGSFSIDDPLLGKLGAEDLDIIEITLAIEAEFQVKIPDEAFMDPDAKQELGVPEGLSGRDFVRIVDKLASAE